MTRRARAYFAWLWAWLVWRSYTAGLRGYCWHCDRTMIRWWHRKHPGCVWLWEDLPEDVQASLRRLGHDD